MLAPKVFLLASLAALFAGCAHNHTPTPPCMRQETDALPVLNKGFSGNDDLRRKQWADVMAYMQCAYPTPSQEGVARLQSLPGFFDVVQPQDVKFLFEDRQQWLDTIMEWAKQRSDDTLERFVAQEYESTQELKKAHEIHIHIYETKNKQAGHDVAFGLLHGWDGGKPDPYAAKVWYAKTYVETGLEKSLRACQMIEDQRAKRKRNQDLRFCTDGGSER